MAPIYTYLCNLTSNYKLELVLRVKQQDAKEC